MAFSTESVILQDAQGNELDFSTDVTDRFKQGLDGRFIGPYVNYIDAIAEEDGGRYRGSQGGLNLLTLPMLYVSDDVIELRQKVREVARFVSPKRGPHTMIVETDDGLERQIRCVYESGIETDPATNGDIYEQLVSLKFRCIEPYWSDVAWTQREFQKAAAPAFSPFPLPMRVGPSSIFNQWEENNTGDVEAWPYWVISGPGNNLELTNETTGKTLSVNYTVPQGMTIVIDTRPGYKTITANGTDIFFASTGELWPLVRGVNDLRIQFNDAETGLSVAQLRYMRRWEGV